MERENLPRARITKKERASLASKGTQPWSHKRQMEETFAMPTMPRGAPASVAACIAAGSVDALVNTVPENIT